MTGLTGRRLYRDGDQWCAVDIHFRNLAIDPAGFGDTQEQAVDELAISTRKKMVVDDFEIGGFCRRCKEWVEEDIEMDGCRDWECPCK